jgi:hypothetical protein
MTDYHKKSYYHPYSNGVQYIYPTGDLGYELYLTHGEMLKLVDDINNKRNRGGVRNFWPDKEILAFWNAVKPKTSVNDFPLPLGVPKVPVKKPTIKGSLKSFGIKLP